MLPLDVANTRGVGGDLPMKELWYFTYLCISLMMFLLIPFASFYYETDDEKGMKTRFCQAIEG